MIKEPFFERFNGWATNSIGLKLCAIGFLVLILLIPSSMIKSLISERSINQNNAVYEVSSKWGGSQKIIGPVLNIPYNEYFTGTNGKVNTSINYLHFMPETLNINGTINPEIRYRGIYEVVLYNADLNLTGSFKFPAIADLGVNMADILWDKATVNIGITDMKGIDKQTDFVFDSKNFAIKPSSKNDIFSSSVEAQVSLNNALLKKEFYDFSVNLSLNGSSSINFIPVAKNTNLELTSSWNNPSFSGAFLPDSRDITEEGFTAKWNVLELNRSIPQSFKGTSFKFNGDNNLESVPAPDMYVDQYNYGETKYYNDNDPSFGVDLMLKVDTYQKNMRSVKYAIMMIFLTFLAFFFSEVINKKRIHPIQYLLVGFSICVFYLLLLSISEHIKFGYAYIVSTIATVSLITLYSKTVFHDQKHSLFLGSILTILYGFFYTLLQLQDYALLIGTIGLFVVLSITMWLSRNIDWYNVQEK